MSTEELNNLPFFYDSTIEVTSKSANIPDSLTSFLNHASKFSHPRHNATTGFLPSPPTRVGKELSKGMSPKKLHEVERMASLVHQVAAEAGCNVVVDVGSGLGYLGQVLHQTYGLSVIGLESSQGHSDGAEKRAAKHGLQCSGMRSVPFLITQDEDSVQEFTALIRRVAASILPCPHSAPCGDDNPLIDSVSHCQQSPHWRSYVCHCQHSAAPECHSSLSGSCRISELHDRTSFSHDFYTAENVCDCSGPVLSKKGCVDSCMSHISEDVESIRFCQTCQRLTLMKCVHDSPLEQEVVRGIEPLEQSGSHSASGDHNEETVLPMCQVCHYKLKRDQHCVQCGKSGRSRQDLKCVFKPETVTESPRYVFRDFKSDCEIERFADFTPGTERVEESSAPASDTQRFSLSLPHPVLESISGDPSNSTQADFQGPTTGKAWENSGKDLFRPAQADPSQPRKAKTSKFPNGARVPSPVSLNPTEPASLSPSYRLRNKTDHVSSPELNSSQLCGNTSSGETSHWHEKARFSFETERDGDDLRVCVIGLHCCGDLSPAMLRLYSEVPFLRALCCISCCYHKMQHQTGSDHFSNFPMSAAANKAYAEVCARRKSSSSSSSSSSSILLSLSSASLETTGLFLTPCSLRLAAQETRVRWRGQSQADHDHHVRHVAYRALLELLFRDMDLPTPDRKRVRKLDYRSFDQFVLSYLATVKLERDEDAEAVKRQLSRLHDEYRQYFPLIKPYTGLQVAMQPVLEWAVLTDRQQWLTERGLPSHLLPVFDERISPRNLALVSTKS